jgi:hypothetical protein
LYKKAGQKSIECESREKYLFSANANQNLGKAASIRFTAASGKPSNNEQ